MFLPFPFLFLLVRGEKVASAQDFVGNQRERTTLGRGFLSFLVYLVTILYYSDVAWSKDLSAYFFCFLPILDREFFFFFCFLPFFLDWEFSLFADSFDREFSPFCFLLRAMFMVSWDFGSRLVERMDMTYVRVLAWPVVQE